MTEAVVYSVVSTLAFGLCGLSIGAWFSAAEAGRALSIKQTTIGRKKVRDRAYMPPPSETSKNAWEWQLQRQVLLADLKGAQDQAQAAAAKGVSGMLVGCGFVIALSFTVCQVLGFIPVTPYTILGSAIGTIGGFALARWIWFSARSGSHLALRRGAFDIFPATHSAPTVDAKPTSPIAG